MPTSRALASGLGLALWLVGFAIPVMAGLREPEMRSDEAIYSYSVERILETGNWLTPRAIPADDAFLEKPPLKVWLVAAAMRAGLTPRDEAGLRFFDGVFGAIAFLYVYLFGRQLAGVAGGLIAALTAFTFDRLVFDHGLRSANMEASVVLCYCGGMYHFARWVESGPGRAAKLHALAMAAFFVLGFMTKFVAAFFLPIVGVVALLWRPDGLRIARARWTEWLVPAALVILVCTPWFVYESWRYGEHFWKVIFGAHVFQRFTSSVDPAHLNPWYFYFTTTWEELGNAGSRIIATAGFLRLAYVAWRGESWLARVALVWAVLPMILISVGTSKLPHYAYPFWPPIALGTGMVFIWALKRLDDRFGPAAERLVARVTPRQAAAWSGRSTAVRRTLAVVALLAAMLSAATAVYGPIRWDVEGMTIFRNSSILRPLFLAVILALIAGYARNLTRLVGVTALALLLPFPAYANRIEKLSRIDHPIREARDCIAEVRASGAPSGAGILAASPIVFHHGYYFYLWRLGPYTQSSVFSPEQTLERLARAGAQTPVLIAREDYETLVSRMSAEQAAGASTPDGLASAYETLVTLINHTARFDTDVAMIFPGPFRPCSARLLATGAQPVWKSGAIPGR
jgi:4-amino-4-deoxy-L-arabinose transferase-like glycosyltransferase